MQSYDHHSPGSICRSLERWSTWTQHHIDSDKAIVDTVNALIAVAAFIAGVQSAIISLSLPLPKTSMGKATNTIGFVGLVLDVVGTFLGVIHAIVLQRRIKENAAVLHAMAQVTTSLKVIQKLHESTTDPEKLTQEQLQEVGIDDPEEHVQRAQRLLQVIQDRFQSPTTTGPFGLAHNVRQVVALTNAAIGIPQVRVETLARSLFGLGHTPLFAMALGVAALIVSVIMFAAESTELSSEVWISCVAVVSGVVTLSLLPVTYETLKIILSSGRKETLPA